MRLPLLALLVSVQRVPVRGPSLPGRTLPVYSGDGESHSLNGTMPVFFYRIGTGGLKVETGIRMCYAGCPAPAFDDPRRPSLRAELV